MTDLRFWLPYGLICFALVYLAGALVARATRPLRERKDVRAILAALGNEELLGVEIAERTGRRHPNYALLARMEEERLIVSRLEPLNWRYTGGRLPRRLYRRAL